MVFVVSCLFGMEKFVADDIDALGYKRLETIDGRVVFEAPEEAVARGNVNFRYAERLFIRLAEFDAPDFDTLFEGVKAIDWQNYIGRLDAFPVKGHAIKSKLFSIPDCQRIVKKAVVEKLKLSYKETFFKETGATVQIEFFILKDKASIMIDTSGVGLHKRGYRPVSNAAPLRETLAAALVTMSRPREGVIIVDPLCGSGTIPIEAALLCTNTAPGLKRSFAGESLPFLDNSIWKHAREEALSKIKKWDSGIYGFDIDPDCVELSKQNAKRAGVEDLVKFAVGDVRSFHSPIEGARGTIVTNPPYGERMGERAEVEKLYNDMGVAFSRNVPNWQVYVINSNETFPRCFGRRPDKARKLYNGMLPCTFYQYFKKKG
ncbi:MAG: class I SAM-dependent RNA methyltransferase [Clostridia bacterium]|nr:class I SAM-dependent RNA methyltransferase [Clostridia bacterium]